MLQTVLKNMTRGEDGCFEGEVGSKVLAFKAAEEIIFNAQIISAEEGDAWKACEQMLSSALKMAASSVSGFYGLELLSFTFSRGIEKFEASAFAQLIVNHAKKLEPGDKRIFPYGSFLLRLAKRIPNDWGKIDFKTYVEVFRKPRSRLDLLIKKKCSEVLQETRYASNPKRLVISDLSQDSLFRFGEEEQTGRLAGFLKKNRDVFKKENLKVFYEDAHREPVDLLAQFQIE